MNKIYYFSKYIILLGFFFLAQQSVFAVPPTQLLPLENDDCVSLDATFRWSSVPNASYYAYLISTSPDFSDTLKKDLSYSDTVVSYQLPNNSTDYYWKAAQKTIGKDLEWSAGFKLTTSPAAPSLVSPADLITCADFEQSFSWSPINNVIDYKVQISKLSNFGATILDTVLTGTTLNFKVSDYFQDYFWRVKARVPGCETDYSTVRQFRTIVGPPMLASATPADSAQGLPSNITLQWPNAPGAENYDLQIADDENFLSLLVDETNYGPNSYDYNNSVSNKRFWWRIRTNGQGCNSEWSESNTFVTAFPKVVALSPTDIDTCVSINATFEWLSLSGANKYEVQASKTENFNPLDILFEDPNVVGTTVVGDVKNAASRIYWRVRVNNDNNFGLWSDVQDFFTTGEAPLVLFPNQGDTEVPRGITFEWTANGPSQGFTLQVAKDTEFTQLEVDETSIVDDKISIVLESYNTKYFYRVRTFYNGCESGWSQIFSFNTIQGFPNLISPADTEGNVSVDALLEWSEVPTANNYDFRIATESDFSNAFGQNGIKTNNFLQRGLEQNTNYFWKVRSNDQWGTTPWSEVFSFSTGAGFTNVPILISPERNTVKVPIDGIMNWRSSENATSYHLQVSNDRNFAEGSIVLDEPNVSDTVYNYTALDNFTEYWFRVASVNATVTSDFSSPNKFRTIAIAPSETALAINPTDGAESVPYEQIKFEWTKVPLTDVGLSNESGYELLISSNQDYSDTLVYNQKVGSEDKTYTSTFSNGVTYFWKVRGWNEAGFGPWSESFSFTTDAFTSVADGNYFDFGASIVPNPIQHNAELRFNLDTPGSVNFVLVDQSGKEVFSLRNISANANQNILPLNFDNLNSGTYLFNLQVGSKYQTGKIIISR